MMKRYTLNIGFKRDGELYFLKQRQTIVEHFKTFKEAESYKDIIDDTVDKALIKDNVTNKIIWLKNY